MKYYIIAGEASGDLHGSNLVASIRQKDPNAKIRAWGGEKMRKNGANVVKNYHDLAFMGFVEVLMNLKTILKNFNICKKDISEFNPDALILIDYPGFNLKIAKWAKKKGYKVFYYISPQVWHGNVAVYIPLRRWSIKCFAFCHLKRSFMTTMMLIVNLLDILFSMRLQKLNQSTKISFTRQIA